MIAKLVELALALVVLVVPAHALAITRASVDANASSLAPQQPKTRVWGFDQGAAKIATGSALPSTRNASGKSACAGGEGVRVHHRNRYWSAELGAFLSPDEFGYLGRRGTLWSWPGQNPIRYRDPSGRDGVYTIEGGWDFGFIAGVDSKTGTVADVSTGEVSVYESANAAVGTFVGGGLSLGGIGYYTGDQSDLERASGIRFQFVFGDATLNFAHGRLVGGEIEASIGEAMGIAWLGGDTRFEKKPQQLQTLPIPQTPIVILPFGKCE